VQDFDPKVQAAIGRSQSYEETAACGASLRAIGISAVFHRLFEVLVSPVAEVAETRCEACGDGCCRFTVDW
jgi:hypothetical protein